MTDVLRCCCAYNRRILAQQARLNLRREAAGKPPVTDEIDKARASIATCAAMRHAKSA